MKAVRVSKYEMNYLKDDGTYLFDDHAYLCLDFKAGFGRVQLYDYTYNYVNTECKTLLKTNVDNCWNFNEGFAEVRINDIWYRIDKECNFYNRNKISFKELYNLYPNKRNELIHIIKEYTYHNVEDYFTQIS